MWELRGSSRARHTCIGGMDHGWGGGGGGGGGGGDGGWVRDIYSTVHVEPTWKDWLAYWREEQLVAHCGGGGSRQEVEQAVEKRKG